MTWWTLALTELKKTASLYVQIEPPRQRRDRKANGYQKKKEKQGSVKWKHYVQGKKEK